MAAARPADPTAAGAASRPVATTEELRRAALQRSAQRGAEVARQRLARRHAARIARLLLTWLAPLLVLGSLGWNSRPLLPGAGPAATPNDSTPTRAGAQAQSPAASARTNRGDP